MRILLIALLLLMQLKSVAQQQVYTFNNGTFLTESELKTAFEAVKKSIPSSMVLTPVIYHQSIKKDTIIHYISFSMDKKVPGQAYPEFKLLYKQDSTFMLLNKKLPGFHLTDLDGNKISSAQLLGKPALINFWAVYCGPCIAEMPQLSMLREKYKDKMNFLSITENTAAADSLIDFLKDKHFNFPVLEDGRMYKNELKISALPRNLFIDKNGILRFIQGNYPQVANSTPVDINDANNYFTTIIEALIKDGQ